MDVTDRLFEEIKKREIVIYGAEIWGKLAFTALDNLGIRPRCFVDRFYKGKEYQGIPIFELGEISQPEKCLFLICGTKGFKSMKTTLEAAGLCFSDIYDLLDFSQPDKLDVGQYDLHSIQEMKEIYRLYARKQEELRLNRLVADITNACTLKCKYCVQRVPEAVKPRIYDVEPILEALKKVVAVVAGVVEFGIEGGEVLLNKNYPRIIKWALSEPKIERVALLTNGTLELEDDVAKLLSNPKFCLWLDDYGDLSRSKQKIIDYCKKNNIQYKIYSQRGWYDVTEVKDYGDTEAELIRKFESCDWGWCFGVAENGVFHRCTRAYYADLYGFTSCHDEEIHVLETDNLAMELKRLLVEKRYLEGCRYCKGSFNADFIGRAEQCN